MALLLAATCLVAVVARAEVLSKSIELLSQRLAQMDPNQLSVAEDFGRRVGAGRLYSYQLDTFPGATGTSLEKLQRFLAKDLGKLEKVSDADAALAVLRHLEPSLSLEQLTDRARCSELMARQVVPACAEYMRRLSDLFEGLVGPVESGELARELEAVRQTSAARDFVLGWAHLRICKLLVEEDKAKLIDKMAKRAGDQIRIEAKLAATRLN